jgi:hypothetical protein
MENPSATATPIPSTVILTPSPVILSPSPVVLSEAKDLSSCSLRVNSAKDLLFDKSTTEQILRRPSTDGLLRMTSCGVFSSAW